MPDLSELEKRVLRAWDNCCEEFDILNFNAIAERSGLDRDTVATVVRGLAAKGLARFARGTFTEDGEPYGSGYGLTDSGRAVELAPAPAVRAEP